MRAQELCGLLADDFVPDGSDVHREVFIQFRVYLCVGALVLFGREL